MKNGKKFKGIDIDGDGVKLGQEVALLVRSWKERLVNVQITSEERVQILAEAQEAIAALQLVFGNPEASGFQIAVAAKETAELLLVVYRALQD